MASSRNPPPIRQLKQIILDFRRWSLRFDFVMDYFKHKVENLQTKYDFDKSTYIASPFVLSIYGGAIHKYEDFILHIELDFEYTRFNAPRDFDTYLRRLYGDYMTPPPLEKRGGHSLYFLDLNLPFDLYDAPYIK